MKMTKFALIALFVSAVASANTVGPDSSFEEIRAAGLIPGFSTIFFQTEGVTVDELCIDGQNIRPVNPYKTTCAKFDNRGNHFNCIEYVTTYLTTPISHQEERCIEYSKRPNTFGECLKSEIVTVDYSLNYNVSIYVTEPRAGLVEVFKKAYSIPACQK